MTPTGVVKLTRLRVPELACLVERARNNLVAVRIVKRNRVHDISMAFQCQQLIPRDRIPHFARAVVRAGDELIARFVEGAVSQGQYMGAQNLEQEEVACFVGLEFLY